MPFTQPRRQVHLASDHERRQQRQQPQRLRTRGVGRHARTRSRSSFTSKTKFAPFVNTVFAESDNPYCIVPAHLLARYHDINHVPFNQLPIGTGPFRVVQVGPRRSRRAGRQRRRISAANRSCAGSSFATSPTRTRRSTCCARTRSTGSSRPHPRRSTSCGRSTPRGTIKLDYVDAPSTYRIYMNTSRPALQRRAGAPSDRLRDRQEAARRPAHRRHRRSSATADQPAFSPVLRAERHDATRPIRPRPGRS